MVRKPFFPSFESILAWSRAVYSCISPLTGWKDEIREEQINPQTAQRQRAFLGFFAGIRENAELQDIWKVNMQ